MDYLAVAKQAIESRTTAESRTHTCAISAVSAISPAEGPTDSGTHTCAISAVSAISPAESPAAILAQLRAHGLDLLAEPTGRVYLAGSPEAVTALPTELVAAMEANWAALRRLATPEPPPELEEIDLPSPCPTCGSLELWQNLLGDWRCQSCDPPVRGMKLLELAIRLRRQHPKRSHGVAP
jgi:hypothetical protein